MEASKKRKTDENGAEIPQVTETLTLDDARKFLEPLTHDQLLTLLTTAVTTHPDLLPAARALADADVSRRKLFVRGIGPETTTDSLKSLFSAYGDLQEAVVITDKSTGKSKGYGFVTFKHVDGALLALRKPSKRIDGRMTVTHLASAGRGPSGEDQATRKIYVGNVPYEVTAERLLDYFLVFGDIEEGPLGFDKQGGKTRGFAFFVYKTEEGANTALMEPMKVIDGHQIMCKLAEDGKKGKAGVSMGNAPMSGGLGDNGGDRMGQNPMNSGYGPPNMGNYPGYGPGSMGGPGGGGYNPPMGGPYTNGPQFGGPPPSGGGDFGSYRMPPPASMPPPSGGPYGQEGGSYGGFPSSGYLGPNVPPQGPPQGPPGPMYQRMPPYY